MKRLLAVMALLISTGSYAAPRVTQVPATHIFAPMGFDSNDTAEVVVSGYLPSFCYKAPQHVVKVVGNEILIEINALMYSAPTSNCLELIVPFTETINVGVLDKGTYNVTVNPEADKSFGGNKTLRTVLKIGEASSDAVDDFIYASVRNIDVRDGQLVLEGYNPSDCLELKEISIVDNGVDTYSILPKMHKTNDFCPIKPTPFEFKTPMPKNLKADNILFHVRVMDGKSVNRVISTLFEL